MVAYAQKGTIVAVVSITASFPVLQQGSNPFDAPFPPLSIPGFKATLTGYGFCSVCPDIMLSPLRVRALEGYRAIRSIKQFTTFFRDVGSALTQSIVNAIVALVNAIPSPLGLTVTDLLKYLTCPLTPFALDLEPSKIQSLNPRVALRLIQKQIGSWVIEVKEQFLRALRSLEAWPIVRVFVQYIESLVRFRITPTSLVEATLAATTVQAACPDTFQGSPFERFLVEASTFNLVGVVPDSLDGLSGQVARQIGNAYVKFEGWSVLSSGAVVAV